MSRRALRRLRGEQRGQEGPGLGELGLGLGLDPGPEHAREGGPPPAPGKGPRGTPRAGVSNRFELIPAEESEDELVAGEERADTRLGEQDTAAGSPQGSRGSSREGAVSPSETAGDGHREGQEAQQPDRTLATSNKPRKKKKKRKTKKNSAGETVEDNDLEDIESLLERMEEPRLAPQSQGGIPADSRPLLYVEHRNLNPENELKRYFGARAVLGDQRPRQRQRQYVRSMWLTAPKNTWPRYSKTGITMQLLDTRRGVQHFTFEHHREYQQVQFKFLDAVESMDPNNIVLLLQMNPYHVDSLLQLSDVCRMQEDQEMARDLIERALYSLECAFHPVFSLTSGTCRLDYRRPENRAFFLALFKHLMFLEKRGCPRTALEFCKLILSLDPENDPLCVLLLIDFLSLRAREYSFLTRLFQEWESHRNLSQLPNFAFSVPLAYLFLSQQEERPELERSQARERAARLIQLALVMFPSVLMPLLDHCSVQPDARVASHPFFGLNAQISQSPALNQLTSLYVGRTHALWKDPAVMAWLEPHVHEVLRMVDAQDALVQEAEHKRKIRYQSAPRNIYRHIILSEMKEATAALPLEVTSQPVMGFDPLPPLDSIVSYTRPERTSHPSNESTLSLFFRSLLPNFNLQGDIRHDGDDEAGAAQDLNQGVNRLMAAMRDMLANIQFQEPPREDNPEGDGDWD
ncbi:ribosome quality control complex subunit TCF25 [Passer domesticus]|uniref:ribosome quality control complex subunit TCF25 n=1 Tax=Passer domesticus TaxID=48849 RepID=UPI0030FEA21F